MQNMLQDLVQVAMDEVMKNLFEVLDHDGDDIIDRKEFLDKSKLLLLHCPVRIILVVGGCLWRGSVPFCFCICGFISRGIWICIVGCWTFFAVFTSSSEMTKDYSKGDASRASVCQFGCHGL